MKNNSNSLVNLCECENISVMILHVELWWNFYCNGERINTMKIMDYRSIFGLILLALMSDCATYMDESDMKGKWIISTINHFKWMNHSNHKSIYWSAAFYYEEICKYFHWHFLIYFKQRSQVYQTKQILVYKYSAMSLNAYISQIVQYVAWIMC